MKKFLFLSLFPLFAFSGNLNELLNLAEQNKQVEASKYSLEASKEKEYATKSSYLPNLTLGATQTFNQESNMFAAEKMQQVQQQFHLLFMMEVKEKPLLNSNKPL